VSYDEWLKEFKAKRSEIVRRLVADGYSDREIAAYFEFDNMKVKQDKFCPLYSQNKKCHNVEYLNCFNCACPYFEIIDEPIEIDDRKLVSWCTIDSKYAKLFVDDNDNVHCDCTDCTVPHTKKSAVKYVSRETFTYRVDDSSSFLDTLRSFQLSEILGKFKLW